MSTIISLRATAGRLMKDHIKSIILEFLGSRQALLLKVSKFRKQNTKFSHPQKNQRNFVDFFALDSKKWLKQKIKAIDDLN